MIDKRKIASGVNLHYLNTEKFQTQTLKISFTKKISEISPSFMSILPFVLLAATEKYTTSKELQKELKSLYGSTIDPVVCKKGEYLSFSFSCNFINKKFSENNDLLYKVYDLLLEIIFSPLVSKSSFDSTIISSEKNNFIDLITSQKNDKTVYANTRMFEIMCKNEDYSTGKYGTVEEAQTITPQNLYNTYVEILNTALIDIFYIGESNPKDLDFKKFTDREELSLIKKDEFSDRNVCEVIENLDIAQGKLSIGFRTNTIACDADYPALVMMNTILGGSTSSKLFSNVREKMSLCYYAFSSVEKVKGVMSINCGVSNKNFKIAKDASIQQFTDIQNGDFSQEEINSAKLTTINNLKSMKDLPTSIEDFYYANSLVNASYDIDELMENIQKVSKDEIVSVAKKVKLDTIYFLKGATDEDV